MVNINIDENSVNRILFDVISRTFEEMAFAEISPLEENVDMKSKDTLYHAAVRVKEPQSLELFIILSSKDAIEIIGNMLGKTDTPPIENEIFDALGEIANTAGGLLARKLFPDTKDYSLSIPQTGIGYPDTYKNTYTVDFSVNGEYFLRSGIKFN